MAKSIVDPYTCKMEKLIPGVYKSHSKDVYVKVFHFEHSSSGQTTLNSYFSYSLFSFSITKQQF